MWPPVPPAAMTIESGRPAVIGGGPYQRPPAVPALVWVRFCWARRARGGGSDGCGIRSPAVAERQVSLVGVASSIGHAASLAQRAETAGFGSVWAAEFYDRSATVQLAAMAAATSSIR